MTVLRLSARPDQQAPVQLSLGYWLLGVVLALVVVVSPAQAQVENQEAQPEDPGPESMIGLWVAQRTFGPEVEGTLTIWRGEAGWNAEIAGLEAAVEVRDGQLRFELAGDRGAFRGRLDPKSQEIHGHWIQPVTPTLGAAYATPMHLQLAEAGHWRGEVRPLMDHFRFFLSVFSEAGEEGQPATIRALLRNPERNLGGRIRADSLHRQGDRVELLNRDGEVVLTGVLRSAWDGEVLSVNLDYVGRTFDFRRADEGSGAAFYPAAGGETYSYRSPRSRGDGWPVAAATKVGLRPEPLTELVRHIRSQRTTSVRDPYLHSLLIARGGQLVLEEYFHGQGSTMTHDTRSAGKSLASMLAGAAFDRYPALSTSTTLAAVFGDQAAEPAPDLAVPSYADRSAWRRQMNLGHLLSMSSGLDCDDNDENSPGGEDRMQSQSEQPDWVRFTLDVPMARPPGTAAFYCSASINLALAAIAHQSGVWWPEAFAEWVAKPLGIERYYFNLTPTGDGYLGGGIRLTARDQLKLGQVMVDSGRWQGRRVLDNAWVEQSLTVQASINGPDDYGYGWWLSTLEHPQTGQSYRVWNASGNGGQLIIGIPELDLVVQFSAGNYSDYRTWSKFLSELVPRYVLPAVAADQAAQLPR